MPMLVITIDATAMYSSVMDLVFMVFTPFSICSAGPAVGACLTQRKRCAKAGVLPRGPILYAPVGCE